MSTIDRVTRGEAATAAGVDVDARNNIGATPLYIASREGNIDVVNVLIAHGADVNARNNDGDTPLLVARRHGHTDVERALLSAGAKAFK
jgi:ankyrin repeat protein